MTRILPTLLLIVAAQLTLAADAEFPGIEALMTSEELRAAGIETLSPQQIDALNAWIERYSTGVIAPADPPPGDSPAPATPATSVAPGIAQDTRVPMDNFRKAPERIDFVSRIAGQFDGWSGRTRFTLENGQVWEQRRGNRWKISLDSPEVRIRENFLGAFEMEVLSEGRSIGVRRLR